MTELVGANLTLKFNIMKKQLLYDSTREVEYEEYSDYCFFNGIEPMGEESEGFYDYVVKVRDWEWDDFLCNIVYSEVNEYEWLITGTVGTWRGEFDVYPTIEPSLEHAIISCIGRGVCEAIIEKYGNTISVEIIHHDGRNHFSLVALTEDGADRFRRHGEVSLKRKENVVKLPEFLF